MIANITKNNFGYNARMLRLEKRISQRELANYCSVTQNYISMIERGIHTPSLQLAAKIAKALDTTIDELLLK